MKTKLLLFSLFIACITITPAAFAAPADGGPQKVLIIYYSYSGNTRTVAEKLQAKTGGDLYRIETLRAYPDDYNALTAQAKRELRENDLPALKEAPPDMSDYDMVLVGAPVWWGTLPAPLMQFLRQADFAGKKTAAFCTHGGGVGQFLPHFKQQAQDAVVLEGVAFRGNRAGSEAVDRQLDQWLDKLNKY